MSKSTRTFIIALSLNAILILLTKLFFLDIIIVRGRSMEPTLGEGAPVLINKAAFGLTEPLTGRYLARWRDPERGEVVVFHSPLDGSVTVKRCAGVAGDVLAVDASTLVVNGRRVPLKFYQEELLEQFTSVPRGQILVLGDNIPASTDSRSFGFVPVERILGTVCFAPALPKAGS